MRATKWSWDITKMHGSAKWTYYHLYVILDIFSRYVVGWMVAHPASAALTEALIRHDGTPTVPGAANRQTGSRLQLRYFRRSGRSETPSNKTFSKCPTPIPNNPRHGDNVKQRCRIGQ
jgi:transposase InsO family protein